MWNVCLIYNGICLTGLLLLVVYFVIYQYKHNSKQVAASQNQDIQGLLDEMRENRLNDLKKFNESEKKLKLLIKDLQQKLDESRKSQESAEDNCKKKKEQLKTEYLKEIEECEQNTKELTTKINKTDAECQDSQRKLENDLKSMNDTLSKNAEENVQLQTKIKNLEENLKEVGELNEKSKNELEILQNELNNLRETQKTELEECEKNSNPQQDVQNEINEKLNNCESEQNNLNSEISKLKESCSSKQEDLNECMNIQADLDETRKGKEECENNLKDQLKLQYESQTELQKCENERSFEESKCNILNSKLQECNETILQLSKGTESNPGEQDELSNKLIECNRANIDMVNQLKVLNETRGKCNETCPSGQSEVSNNDMESNQSGTAGTPNDSSKLQICENERLKEEAKFENILDNVNTQLAKMNETNIELIEEIKILQKLTNDEQYNVDSNSEDCEKKRLKEQIVFNKTINNFNSELAQLNATQIELKKELDALTKRKGNAINDFADVSNETEANSIKCNEICSSEKDELESKLVKMNDTNIELMNEIRKLQESKGEQNNTDKNLENCENKRLNEQIVFNNTINHLESEISQLNATQIELKKELDALTNRNGNAVKDFADVSNETEGNSLKSNEICSSEKDELESKLVKMNDTNIELMNEIRKLQESKGEQNNTDKNLENCENKRLNEQIVFNNTINHLESEISQLNATQIELKKELDALTNRNGNAVKDFADVSNETEGNSLKSNEICSNEKSELESKLMECNQTSTNLLNQLKVLNETEAKLLKCNETCATGQIEQNNNIMEGNPTGTGPTPNDSNNSQNCESERLKDEAKFESMFNIVNSQLVRMNDTNIELMKEIKKLQEFKGEQNNIDKQLEDCENKRLKEQMIFNNTINNLDSELSQLNATQMELKKELDAVTNRNGNAVKDFEDVSNVAKSNEMCSSEKDELATKLIECNQTNTNLLSQLKVLNESDGRCNENFSIEKDELETKLRECNQTSTNLLNQLQVLKENEGKMLKCNETCSSGLSEESNKVMENNQNVNSTQNDSSEICESVRLKEEAKFENMLGIINAQLARMNETNIELMKEIKMLQAFKGEQNKVDKNSGNCENEILREQMIFNKTINNLNSELSQLNATQQELMKELDALTKQKGNAVNEEEELPKCEDIRKNLTSQLSELNKTNNDLKKELDALKEIKEDGVKDSKEATQCTQAAQNENKLPEQANCKDIENNLNAQLLELNKTKNALQLELDTLKETKESGKKECEDMLKHQIELSNEISTKLQNCEKQRSMEQSNFNNTMVTFNNDLYQLNASQMEMKKELDALKNSNANGAINNEEKLNMPDDQSEKETELSKCKDAENNLNLQLSKLNQTNNDLQNELNALKMSKENADKDSEDQSKNQKDIDAKLKNCETHLSTEKIESENIQNKLNLELSQLNDTCISQNATFQSELIKCNELQSNLKQEFDALQENYTKMQNECTESSTRPMQETNGSGDELKSCENNRLEEQRKFNDTIKNLNSQLERLNKSNAETNNELQSLKELNLNTQKNPENEKKSENCENQQSNELKNCENNRLREQQKFNDIIKNLNSQILRLNESYVETKSELHDLKDLKSNYGKEKEMETKLKNCEDQRSQEQTNFNEVLNNLNSEITLLTETQTQLKKELKSLQTGSMSTDPNDTQESFTKCEEQSKSPDTNLTNTEDESPNSQLSELSESNAKLQRELATAQESTEKCEEQLKDQLQKLKELEANSANISKDCPNSQQFYNNNEEQSKSPDTNLTNTEDESPNSQLSELSESNSKLQRELATAQESTEKCEEQLKDQLQKLKELEANSANISKDCPNSQQFYDNNDASQNSEIVEKLDTLNTTLIRCQADIYSYQGELKKCQVNLQDQMDLTRETENKLKECDILNNKHKEQESITGGKNTTTESSDMNNEDLNASEK